ncbi:MAG: hypothetical protein ACXW3K_06210 [Brevundimonas sp.]
MSFREKHLWISIVASVGVWGFYYWRLIGRIMDGALGAGDFANDMGGLFVACLVVSVVVEVVLTAIATWTTRKAEREAKDEREMLASLKASHVALMALIFLVVTQAGAAWFTSWLQPAFGVERGFDITQSNAWVVLANILLASVIIAEMIRAGLTLALLRRLR